MPQGQAKLGLIHHESQESFKTINMYPLVDRIRYLESRSPVDLYDRSNYLMYNYFSFNGPIPKKNCLVPQCLPEYISPFSHPMTVQRLIELPRCH